MHAIVCLLQRRLRWLRPCTQWHRYARNTSFLRCVSTRFLCATVPRRERAHVECAATTVSLCSSACVAQSTLHLRVIPWWCVSWPYLLHADLFTNYADLLMFNNYADFLLFCNYADLLMFNNYADLPLFTNYADFLLFINYADLLLFNNYADLPLFTN